MTARVVSATAYGFEGRLIDIECDLTKGLPAFSIVGLGNKAIDEAKERVRSAIRNSHLDFPAKKLTINLAPANLPKDGSHFDLPIALAVLIYVGAIADTGAVIAGIIAAYLLVSALLTRCVFYKMIGVDTTTQEQSYSTTDDRSGL